MIERLIEKLSSLRYPVGIIEVRADINGPAFFPGGRGLLVRNIAQPGYAVGKHVPVDGVLVLGHNFPNRKGYEAAKSRSGEVALGSNGTVKNPTWRHLLDLMSEVSLRADRCFFTNAYMGVMDSKSACGSHEGFGDAYFQEDCRDIFLCTLALQRPQLIVSLGLPAVKFLASIAEDSEPWRKASSWLAIDEQRFPKQVRFAKYDEPVFVVPLVHPSYRLRNVRLRKYGNYQGSEAERHMLTEGLTHSQILN